MSQVGVTLPDFKHIDGMGVDQRDLERFMFA